MFESIMKARHPLKFMRGDSEPDLTVRSLISLMKLKDSKVIQPCYNFGATLSLIISLELWLPRNPSTVDHCTMKIPALYHWTTWCSQV